MEEYQAEGFFVSLGIVESCHKIIPCFHDRACKQSPMPSHALKTKAKPSLPRGSGGPEQSRDWKSLFKKTIFLVLAISLAIHVLFLLAFGSVAIFKGSVPKLPFVSQEIAAEAVAETAPPPVEEQSGPVEEATPDPFAQEIPESSAPEESAPALEMLTVVGGANWAPAIPKNAPVSETGVIGGTGKGTGTVAGGGKGPGGPVSGKQLFGVTIQARKLGVVVSINKGAQNSGRLPGIFKEIFKEFPDSPVFLTNGGGMRDWDVVEMEFNKKVEENNKRKKAGEPYDKFLGKEIKRPELGRFNTGAALDWVVIRGFKPDPEYPGLKEKHPELFEDLRKRPNVWFISSNKEADGAYLAFEELMKKGVEAIYWYNQFDRPIEGKESEEVAKKIIDSKIEILVQNQGSRAQGMEWLNKVGAKFVK